MMPIRIAVFSDVICPWCFVGKRRLEQALGELGLAQHAQVTWLPFELNPDMPAGGMPRADYRARKFGPERAAKLDAEMTRTGREDGIAFAFDQQARTPNTRAAHAALVHAGALGFGPALKEALLRAYFEEGRDIGDPGVIAEVGQAVGLAREGVLAALVDERTRAEVVALERRAAEIGVQGVPFFIVDDSWAVSGAQASDEWVRALRAKGLAEPAAAP